jgi:hypothetical protein
MIAKRPAFLLLLALPQLFAGPPSGADDIDLLRFGSADPYVMVVLDTSSSMCLDLRGQAVDADCDDPRSRLYLAKQALYDAFLPVDGVQYGFFSYNQDQLKVRAKHWLYYGEPSRNSLPANWPLAWPTFDGDGIDTAAGGVDIDGDMVVFGYIPSPALTDSANKIWGSCDRPIDFRNERRNLNRYPKLGQNGTTATVLWVSNSNTKYRFTFSNPTAADKLGDSLLRVELKIERLKNNASCAVQTFDSTWTANLTFTRWRDFLMWDDTAGSVYLVAGMNQAKNAENTDATGWTWHDGEGTYSCGVKKPFSGKGMEGNYDSTSAPASTPLGYDRYCAGGTPASCYNLKWQTIADPTYRELDYGDFLTWHWERSNRDEFLARLNPLHADNGRGFGGASFFDGTPDADSGVLELKSEAKKPLVGGGISPLSDATLDYRCWYSSSAVDNKCADSSAPYYTKGFDTIANQTDGAWTCRRPYLILVTDGENNCSGENVAADVANLFSKTRTQTWVVNLGGNLTGVVNNGKGEEVFVDTEEQLRDEMRQIVGTIEQEKRAFASAAVPSVQADVADKIYLTQFTPLNGKSVWPAKVDAYLKPLPIDTVTRQPDPAHPNHLWDAAAVLRAEQAPKPAAVTLPLDNSELRLGLANNERRVYYPLDPAATTGVPLTRRLLDPVAGSSAAANDLREDLWRGFGLVGASFELGAANTLAPTMSVEETQAQTLLKSIYQTRTVTYQPDPDEPGTVTVEYVMGDVFHANPQVIGGPQNSVYFSLDFPGYRKFAQEQQNRRKILVVGSNDGQLHVFDAGQFLVKTVGGKTFGEFSNGTGRELFAYVPRATLGTVARLAGDTQRLWGIDGNAAVADVYIDPQHGGTPTLAQREWRTTLISGLRQGGRAVFALDITQPDPLELNDQLKRYVPTFNPVSSGATEAPDTAAGCAETLGGSAEAPCDTELKYPQPLWEFTDRADEDLNGAADLGETWSTPNVGAIPVRVSDGSGGSRVENRFVAIFGGGYDATGGSGNFLYMVDIETGKTLYKRLLNGAAAAEPAAVDLDQDGVIDRVYVGTTRGYLYRVDTKVPATLSTGFGPGGSETRITSTEWEPYVLFDTLSGGVRRPIYFRPSVIFVARLGLYAVAFGTGQRDNLWTYSAAGGERFYTLVDESSDAGVALPYTEANLVRIALGDSNLEWTNFLEDKPPGYRGWYLVFEAGSNERLVTPPLTLSGLIFFSTYLPFLESTPDPTEPKLTVCEKRGDSRSYSLFAFNGNGATLNSEGDWTRFRKVDDVFVSEPFVEQFQTGNAGGSATTSPLPADLDFAKLMEELKAELFSPRCHFNPSYRFDIRTVRSDTGVEYIASVPICLLPSNWRPED